VGTANLCLAKEEVVLSLTWNNSNGKKRKFPKTAGKRARMVKEGASSKICFQSGARPARRESSGNGSGRSLGVGRGRKKLGRAVRHRDTVSGGRGDKISPTSFLKKKKGCCIRKKGAKGRGSADV